MSSSNLANLERIGKLKAEAVSQDEFEGLVRSGRRRLTDARVEALSLESRFDLAYNASHALALAALRWHGYRSANRYLVFQCLQFTLGMRQDEWRLFELCHRRRNVAEYEGALEIEDRLVADLIEGGERLVEKVDGLGKVTSARNT